MVINVWRTPENLSEDETEEHQKIYQKHLDVSFRVGGVAEVPVSRQAGRNLMNTKQDPSTTLGMT